MLNSDTVECPECHDEFDPLKTAGWCTNPNCGEYRYEQELSESAPSNTSGDSDRPDQPQETIQQTEPESGHNTYSKIRVIT